MNLKDTGGNTPLFLAIQRRSEECLKLVESMKCDLIEILLEAGASVNGMNSRGKTPLIQAVYVVNALTEEPERVKCVNILTEAGADVNAVSKENGYTALMYASYSGFPKCVDLLLKSGADVNACADYGGSALLETAKRYRSDCFKILLEAGADVNVTYNGGNTALFITSMWPGYKHIDLLLKAGAEVNIMDEGGRTPLMIASSYGRKRSVDLLLKAGADVNLGRDEKGESALIMSSLCGHYECVDMLLNAGADVNDTCYDDSNALHVNRFIRLRHLHRLPKCFRILLRAGIQINKFTKPKGKNALGTLVRTKKRFKKEKLEHVGYGDGLLLLYAAGETLEGTEEEKIPEELKFEDEKLQLKHICREAIRKHLLKL